MVADRASIPGEAPQKSGPEMKPYGLCVVCGAPCLTDCSPIHRRLQTVGGALQFDPDHKENGDPGPGLVPRARGRRLSPRRRLLLSDLGQLDSRSAVM